MFALKHYIKLSNFGYSFLCRNFSHCPELRPESLDFHTAVENVPVLIGQPALTMLPAATVGSTSSLPFSPQSPFWWLFCSSNYNRRELLPDKITDRKCAYGSHQYLVNPLQLCPSLGVFSRDSGTTCNSRFLSLQVPLLAWWKLFSCCSIRSSNVFI